MYGQLRKTLILVNYYPGFVYFYLLGIKAMCYVFGLLNIQKVEFFF